MKPLESLDPARFDTAPILKRLASGSRRLAELKGLAASIPHQAILINTGACKRPRTGLEAQMSV